MLQGTALLQGFHFLNGEGTKQREDLALFGSLVAPWAQKPHSVPDQRSAAFAPVSAMAVPLGPGCTH